MSNQNKILLGLICAVVGCLILTLAATASAYVIEPTADRNQVSNYLFYAANDYGAKAQTFTTIGAGEISAVVLNFAQTSGVDSVPFVVEVQTVTGGSPDGGVVGTSDVYDANTFAAVCTDFPINFSTPAPVSAATEYALVIIPVSGFGPGASANRWICGQTGGYAGGILYNSTANTSTWAVESTGDAYVYIDITEGGGGGSGTSTSATTTINYSPTEHIYDMFVLFFLGMAFIIWLMRK